MSVYDKDGKCSRAGARRTETGSFAAPHGLALDSKNDLYVSEVTWTFAVSRGRAAEDCHTFQKFALEVWRHLLRWKPAVRELLRTPFRQEHGRPAPPCHGTSAPARLA